MYVDYPKTLFIDIDGTILKHEIETFTADPSYEPTVLPGSIEKLKEWKSKGYIIILTTGRPASRIDTEKQLQKLGIPYDHLLMNIGAGARFVINDKKPDGKLTAGHFNPDRDHGIGDIDI